MSFLDKNKFVSSKNWMADHVTTNQSLVDQTLPTMEISEPARLTKTLNWKLCLHLAQRLERNTLNPKHLWYFQTMLSLVQCKLGCRPGIILFPVIFYDYLFTDSRKLHFLKQVLFRQSLTVLNTGVSYS